MRTVIIGNSGSGKTWLAERFADIYANPVVHLDELFWEPGGFDRKRAPSIVSAMIEVHRQSRNWIVEGVFGSLAAPFLEAAESLIWLDIPWEICCKRLQIRGSESKSHMDRDQSEAGLAKLLVWAQGYYSRDSDCSKSGHMALFCRFSGLSYRFRNPADVDEYLTATQRDYSEGRLSD